jgi:hypothetical protein
MNKLGKLPVGVIGLFVFLSIMLFGILYMALKYVPVTTENWYQMPYQSVDKNYNSILLARENFDKKYNFDFVFHRLSENSELVGRMNGTFESYPHTFKMGENDFSLRLTDKQGNAVKGATFKILMTRYETGEFDFELHDYTFEDGLYTSEKFTIDKQGRWKIIAKIVLSEEEGAFFETGVYAK